jgi:FAD/FMN-containing dehydrogenase
VLHPLCRWQDPADDERMRRWALDAMAKLRPWSIDPISLNYVGNVSEENLWASFGRDNYVKLGKLKAQYDPNNLFHRNYNIKPT